MSGFDLPKRPLHGTRPVRIALTATFFVVVLAAVVAMWAFWISPGWLLLLLVLMFAAAYGQWPCRAAFA